MAVAVAGVVTVVAQSPASAAGPARKNTKSEPVYFVHGIDWNHAVATNAQVNCKSAWNSAETALRNGGWTGKFITWGYYKKDLNCTRKVGGNLETRIQELGRLLAWDIYNNYSRHGKAVDVVGHSMGGLVIRAAITGVKRYHQNADWPDYLYIEDVATFSTPYSGTNWATACTLARGWNQCSDLRPGSGFLSWAGQNPQSNMGTDWTLMGASDDDTVTSGAAISMTAKHKAIYAAGQGLEHSSFKNKGPGPGWKLKYSHNNGSTWHSTSNGPGPLKLMMNALYYQSAS
jgi:hypothetical protein